MIKFLIIIFSIFLFTADQWADIIIKKDKKGRIIISNTPSKKKRSRRYNKKYTSRSKTRRGPFTVPIEYRDKIDELSKQHDVRKDLIVAVIRAESSFNPFAVSKKGAVGLMQLMPQTAKQYGVSNRYNPNQNMEAGVKHLKYLLKRYKGNIPLALAGYNAGEHAVKKYNGVPPYWETQNYVKKIMRFIGQNFNLTITRKQSMKIYKYFTSDGKIIITDSLPKGFKGKYEVID